MKSCKMACFCAVLLVTSAGARCQEVATPQSSVSSVQTPSRLYSLDFTKVAVVDVLEMINRQGDVDIIIGKNVTGTLKNLNIKDKTVEQILQIMAKAAGLKVIKLDYKTFIVDKLAVDEPAISSNSISRKVTLSINIHEMSLPDAFRAIARKGDVQVFVDDSVQGLVKNFVLNDVEPVQALRLLASSSGCSLVTTENIKPDGTHETECFIAKSRRAVPVKPPTLPDTVPYSSRPGVVQLPREPRAQLKIVPPPNVDLPFSRPLAAPPR